MLSVARAGTKTVGIGQRKRMKRGACLCPRQRAQRQEPFHGYKERRLEVGRPTVVIQAMLEENKGSCWIKGEKGRAIWSSVTSLFKVAWDRVDFRGRRFDDQRSSDESGKDWA